MIKADFIVVGSGLTGSTIARILADHDQQVIVLERKDHIAGNVFDFQHHSGMRIHKYGPHYFRCNSQSIWNFLNRFSSFYDWSAEVQIKTGSEYFAWPLQQELIDKFLKEKTNHFNGEVKNFEAACLNKIPRNLYYKFIKGYTEKQWGVAASHLDKELASRISINGNNERTLTAKHKWNALPENGYTALVQNMLEGIEVISSFDYLANRGKVHANKLLIFTGAIDEYFNFLFGKLKYRGQKRLMEYFPETREYQPCVQINYSEFSESRIRTIEWKHLLKGEERTNINGTVITHETPYTPESTQHYEYPFPDLANNLLYQQYRKEADKLNGVIICGRLGEYKYYDMDQAVGRAIKLSQFIQKQYGIYSVPTYL